MRKRNLGTWTGLGAALLAATTAPAVAHEPQDGTAPAARQDEFAGAGVLIHVDGMSCPLCANGLEQVLREIPAIDDLAIRVSDGLVQIRLVDGAALTDEELDEAVERAGFSVR